jgi:exodeoxyribonuclease VII small subunit
MPRLKRKPPLNFEANLVELERLVERMERGDLTLEDSLQQFEQGIGLIRACQQALQTAEQKVQLLTGDGQGEALTDFESLPGADQDDD